MHVLSPTEKCNRPQDMGTSPTMAGMVRIITPCLRQGLWWWVYLLTLGIICFSQLPKCIGFTTVRTLEKLKTKTNHVLCSHTSCDICDTSDPGSRWSRRAVSLGAGGWPQNRCKVDTVASIMYVRKFIRQPNILPSLRQKLNVWSGGQQCLVPTT